MALITYPLNGIQFTAEDAETYLCTRTSGVFSAENNFMAYVTGDREITIGEGIAWINNGTRTGKSVVNTASVVLSIPVSDGALPRIDRIVLRFSKAANSSSIVIKTGTPASSPVAPEVTRTELMYELALYDVYVGAASLTVGEGDVTNKMLDETVCGLMRDGVTGIPTAQLEAQASALIESLRDALVGVTEGTGWMLKAVYDADNDGAVDVASGGTGATYPAAACANIGAVTQDEFKALAVGGVNLYTGTKNFDGTSWPTISMWSDTGETYKGLKVLMRNSKWNGLYQEHYALADEQYTFSAYVKAADGSSVRFNAGGGTATVENGTATAALEADVWTRLHYTFKVTADGTIHPRLENANATELRVCGLKLERGNVPSDWSPAPEDTTPESIGIMYVDTLPAPGNAGRIYLVPVD